jgi:hypothetical protein
MSRQGDSTQYRSKSCKGPCAEVISNDVTDHASRRFKVIRAAQSGCITQPTLYISLITATYPQLGAAAMQSQRVTCT